MCPLHANTNFLCCSMLETFSEFHIMIFCAVFNLVTIFSEEKTRTSALTELVHCEMWLESQMPFHSCDMWPKKCFEQFLKKSAYFFVDDLHSNPDTKHS